MAATRGGCRADHSFGRGPSVSAGGTGSVIFRGFRKNRQFFIHIHLQKPPENEQMFLFIDIILLYLYGEVKDKNAPIACKNQEDLILCFHNLRKEEFSLEKQGAFVAYSFDADFRNHRNFKKIYSSFFRNGCLRKGSGWFCFPLGDAFN